jgi:hypothetical protein
MTDYVIATGVSTMRATVGDDTKVTDSTGGMLTGLTERQLRKMVTDHHWTMIKLGDDEPKDKDEEEDHPAPKKKGSR